MAKIWVEAYGCSASFSDSEMISGMIANGGHALAASPSEADLSVVVTCSVKDATASRMIHRIRSLGSGGRPLVVAGCLPKAERPTVERISRGASMLGPDSVGRALDVVDAALRGERAVELGGAGAAKTELPRVRINPAVGIVQIASGCMSECTFCQTKISKGGLQSYRLGDIVRQVRRDTRDGCREIWLTSTDNGCYGFDIGADLPRLIDAVAGIPREFMIRVGMMNPMYMPRIRDGLIESYRNGKVYKFIHVPVQAGSDRILNEMRRGHTASTFADAVGRIRAAFPRFTVSTDIIVGFPTETEEEFGETVRLLEETRPDVVNLSKYSRRPGTDAASMEQVDASEVKRRSKAVAALADRLSLEGNRRWVGWRGRVLFSDRAAGRGGGIRGRNFAYKPVFLEGGPEPEIGQSRIVEVTGATTHSLIGRIAS